MAKERGLVVMFPCVVEGNSIHIKSNRLDSQEIRSSLLFWDKLDFPENTKSVIQMMDLSSDEQFLLDTGVMHRTKVSVTGPIGEQYRGAHIKAFRELDQKEPGVWSLATGERSISFKEDDLNEGRGALVKLYRAIPVPSKDVPLQDILEFKQKRQGELLALRHHLEAIYQRVITAADGDLAAQSEIEHLEMSIADHIKASKEAGFPVINSTLSASLNLWEIGKAAAIGYALGLPLVSALMAGAASAVSISAGTSLKWGSKTATPYKYVSAYHDQVFP